MSVRENLPPLFEEDSTAFACASYGDFFDEAEELPVPKKRIAKKVSKTTRKDTDTDEQL